MHSFYDAPENNFDLREEFIPLLFELPTQSSSIGIETPDLQLSSTARVLSFSPQAQKEEKRSSSAQSSPLSTPIPFRFSEEVGENTADFNSALFLEPPLISPVEDQGTASTRRNPAVPGIHSTTLAQEALASSPQHLSLKTPKPHQTKPAHVVLQKKYGPLQKRKQEKRPEMAYDQNAKKHRKQEKNAQGKKDRYQFNALLADIRSFLPKEKAQSKTKASKYKTVFTLFQQARRDRQELVRLQSLLAQPPAPTLAPPSTVHHLRYFSEAPRSTVPEQPQQESTPDFLQHETNLTSSGGQTHHLLP